MQKFVTSLGREALERTPPAWLAGGVFIARGLGSTHLERSWRLRHHTIWSIRLVLRVRMHEDLPKVAAINPLPTNRALDEVDLVILLRADVIVVLHHWNKVAWSLLLRLGLRFIGGPARMSAAGEELVLAAIQVGIGLQVAVSLLLALRAGGQQARTRHSK